METFIITFTTGATLCVDGVRWTQDDDGNRYVYDTDSRDADPVAEIDAEEFVAIQSAQTPSVAAAIDAVFDDCGDAVAAYEDGGETTLRHLTGQVCLRLNGEIDPRAVSELIADRLDTNTNTETPDP